MSKESRDKSEPVSIRSIVGVQIPKSRAFATMALSESKGRIPDEEALKRVRSAIETYKTRFDKSTS